MTRVERNNKKYKKRVMVKKKGWKGILKCIIALIVGVIYITYKIIKWFNNLIAKLFMELPRLIRVGIVYGIIAFAIYGNVNPRVVIKEIVKEEEIKIKLDRGDLLKEEKKEEPNIVEIHSETCNLGEIECKIYNKSIEYGLSREQAFIVVSISRHETGKWTSKAFLNKNNLGGIMCSTGLRSYNSLDDGIDAFVSLLKRRYFDRGLDTIEKIQPVYCPVGAINDPHNLNQYWLPMVTKYYNEYLNK